MSSPDPPVGGTGVHFSIRSCPPRAAHPPFFSTLAPPRRRRRMLPLQLCSSNARSHSLLSLDAPELPNHGHLICAPGSQERTRSSLSSPGCGRLHRAMGWLGTGPEGPGKATRPHAGTDSSSSLSDLHRRRSASRYMNGGRPGLVLAQKLDAPLPLIKCDDYPKKVLRPISTTPEHPGWVFIKCSTNGACATLASVVLSDLTNCANLKFYCVEWMQALVLERRVHRYIDRA